MPKLHAGCSRWCAVCLWAKRALMVLLCSCIHIQVLEAHPYRSTRTSDGNAVLKFWAGIQTPLLHMHLSTRYILELHVCHDGAQCASVGIFLLQAAARHHLSNGCSVSHVDFNSSLSCSKLILYLYPHNKYMYIEKRGRWLCNFNIQLEPFLSHLYPYSKHTSP